MPYAENTSVSSEKSRAEIEKTITKYGADRFAYGWDENDRAVISFRMNGRHIKFLVAMPDKEDFSRTAGGRRRRDSDAKYKAWEQACRQKWRAMYLVIKAKLEAVEAGISVFEDEFMAHIVLPDGQTVGEYMTPQIEAAYSTGKMPPMLPYLEE